MKFKNRIKRAFQNRVMKPQLKRLDEWEKNVIDRPDALRLG
jgi:hypothetical protein